MSQVALRAGRFFSWHTLDQASRKRRAAPAGARPSGVPRAPEPCGRDDLAYFGLCVDVNHDDPYAELDRLSLVSPAAEVWDARDDPRLFLL
jgi:hypothetical protein